MAFIDGTVVNVALPALQKNLNATLFDLQWVVESYALFLAALLLAGGSLGDRFGRRRIFCVGVALFALASIGCGLAQSVSDLIVARAAQGIGGAFSCRAASPSSALPSMKRSAGRQSAHGRPSRRSPPASVRSWAAG